MHVGARVAACAARGEESKLGMEILVPRKPNYIGQDRFKLRPCLEVQAVVQNHSQTRKLIQQNFGFRRFVAINEEVDHDTLLQARLPQCPDSGVAQLAVLGWNAPHAANAVITNKLLQQTGTMRVVRIERAHPRNPVRMGARAVADVTIVKAIKGAGLDRTDRFDTIRTRLSLQVFQGALPSGRS